MIALSGQQLAFIIDQGQNYMQRWRGSVLSVLKQVSSNFVDPPEITTFISEVNNTLRYLDSALSSHHHEFAPEFPLSCDDWIAPVIKTIITSQRRRLANNIHADKDSFTHQGLRASIERTLEPFEQLIQEKWFQGSGLRRAPRLSDFLTIERLEAEIAQSDKRADRVYDEKFHILQSPSLFFTDLAYYRKMCEMRDIPVSVAYIDIDDFKSFNTEYQEPNVDRFLLPRFMRTLEGHLFFRGSAYRYGGDEYVVLLPNASQEMALNILRGFQSKLAELDYEGGISRRPTVSIGLSVIDPDCWLTEREIEVRAAKAKNFAKHGGKNCIAYYISDRLAESELAVMHPEATSTVSDVHV